MVEVTEKLETIGVVPVPLRMAVCGDPEALSETEIVAEKLAAEAGVKVIEMVQEEPAARVDPQVVADCAKSLGFVPAMLIAMPVSGALPVFCSVADCGAEVVPVLAVKVSEGVSATAGN